MAKYAVEITENEIFKKLEFMDVEFFQIEKKTDDSTLRYGFPFTYQVKDTFFDIDNYVLELIDDITFSDLSEIQHIISILSNFEKENLNND